MKIGLVFLAISLLAACETCQIVSDDFGCCDKADLYELIVNKHEDTHSIRAAVNAGWDAFNADYQTWIPYVVKWKTILDRLVILESGGIKSAARELRIEIVDLLDDDLEFRKGAFRRISIGPPVGKLDALERVAGLR